MNRTFKPGDKVYHAESWHWGVILRPSADQGWYAVQVDDGRVVLWRADHIASGPPVD